MKPWRGVHLTRARQVGELMELRGAALPASEVPVREHYEALRRSDPAAAVGFIGHALPRLDAIHWAADMLDTEKGRVLPEDRGVLALVRDWLEAPDDDGRRNAYAAAAAAERESPARILAGAVFYSGGSIAPPGVAPVQPAPALANRLAAVAVAQAAYRSDDPQAFFEEALLRAEAIAEHGASAPAHA